MFRLICMTWLLMFSRMYGQLCMSYYELGYVCELTNETVFKTLHDDLTIMECAAKCSSNSHCMSAQVDVMTKECHLNSEKYTMSTACSPLVQYAALEEHSCRKLINENCTFSYECFVENSQCFEGKCQCNPGYSYNHSNESCLTSCDVYGSTFTFYPGYRINGFNDKTVNQGSTTEHECERACAEETSFVCRTVDFRYSSTVCYLSRETAFTQPLEFLVDPNLDHFHRNCQ